MYIYIQIIYHCRMINYAASLKAVKRAGKKAFFGAIDTRILDTGTVA